MAILQLIKPNNLALPLPTQNHIFERLTPLNNFLIWKWVPDGLDSRNWDNEFFHLTLILMVNLFRESVYLVLS